MRCTDRKLTPAAFASIRPVQWVASPGGVARRPTKVAAIALANKIAAGLIRG
jgi:hypothetical protein